MSLLCCTGLRCVLHFVIIIISLFQNLKITLGSSFFLELSPIHQLILWDYL